MGIGLYLVKKIATLMGGTITYSSEPNRFTCFSLTLPLQPRFIKLKPVPDHHIQIDTSAQVSHSEETFLLSQVEDLKVYAMNRSYFEAAIAKPIFYVKKV
jgi:hypothetical protein